MSWKVIKGTVGISEQQFIDIYSSIRSSSAISRTVGPDDDFTVVSNGAGAPYNIMHLNVANIAGDIRGEAFTANTDGTITVNKDMFGALVIINLVAKFSGSDYVVVGIGIGDPNSIPQNPGEKIGENFVSRFRCASVGEGNSDEVSFNLSVLPVGKSTTGIEVNGLKAGDKIFPVVWTQESDNAQLEISELIFLVEEISF